MLDDLITRKALQDLAGAVTFQRGEKYFANEAVSRVRVVEEKVSARVEGSDICHRNLLIALAGKLEAAQPADAVTLARMPMAARMNDGRRGACATGGRPCFWSTIAAPAHVILPAHVCL